MAVAWELSGRLPIYKLFTCKKRRRLQVHFGSKAHKKGVPEIMGCRILMFMWSLEPLCMGFQELRALPGLKGLGLPELG